MNNTIVIDVSCAGDQTDAGATTSEEAGTTGNLQHRNQPCQQQQQPCDQEQPPATTMKTSSTPTPACSTTVRQRSVEVIVDDLNETEEGIQRHHHENLHSNLASKKCVSCSCHVVAHHKQSTSSSRGNQETIASNDTHESTEITTASISPTTIVNDKNTELSATITCKKHTKESSAISFSSSSNVVVVVEENIQQLNILTNECCSVPEEHTCQQNSPNKSVNSNCNEKICRICLDTVDEGELIAPCKCSGSTKYAHESCLLKWFFKSSKKSCEVCLGNVNVTPVGYKPVQEWRLPESGCDFIVYLFGLYFLIMVIFTGMITWIATQGCTSPVCVTLYCVCGIAVFYFFYCCGCVEYSRRYWKALLSVNKIWRIYGREDSIKNFKHNIQQPTEDNRPNISNLRRFVIDINENERTRNNNKASQIGVDNYAVEVEEPCVEQ